MSCKASWCDSRSLIKGFCNRHYLQNKRHGRLFKTGFDKREIKVDGDLGKIELTKGKVALIDATDVDLVKGYQWYFDGQYAATNLPNRKKLRLHTLIVSPSGNLVVDHISRDKLDNRRSNLRECSPSSNNHNKEVKNPHGLRGVTWNKRKQKWVSQISIGDKNKGLGYHLSKEAAAKAYDEKAKELYGEFARLNYA